MNFKPKEIKRITIKSPSIPLLPVFDRKKITKGEANISSLWKREVGRDFQSAKVLSNRCIP
jgi:hypothetical protein